MLAGCNLKLQKHSLKRNIAFCAQQASQVFDYHLEFES